MVSTHKSDLHEALALRPEHTMKRERDPTASANEDEPRPKKARSQCHINDLDNGCLLHIFKKLMPLPDLFSVAATCKRFKQLTTDKRLTILVTQEQSKEQRRNTGRRVLLTLQAAVQASRAGDTIVLEAGQQHDAHDIVIPWPLKLVGSGAAPEDTVLVCPKGSEAALDFRSTGKVANMTIQATLSNCILHRRGSVVVEGCKLQCHAGGLEHLFTPLVTLAAAGIKRRQQPMLRSAGREAGMGSLSVVETKIRGGTGATAVKCGGTGALQQVRVIHLSRDTLFWFDVHAGKPGCVTTSSADGNSQTSLLTGSVGSAHIDKPTMQQSSVGQSATPLQNAISAPQAVDAGHQDVMLQRIKAWNATHHLLTAIS